jgi:uncharacterized protein YbjQ (UPF0145 family)
VESKMTTCNRCGREYNSAAVPSCPRCKGATAPKVDRGSLSSEAVSTSPRHDVLIVTTPEVPGHRILRVHGPLFAAQSQWASGMTKQKARLTGTMAGALDDLGQQARSRGANAVVGLSMAANSSQGSSSAFLGSSDAIILMGTAVTVTPIPAEGPSVLCPECAEPIRSVARKCRHCGSAIGAQDTWTDA